MKIRFSTASRKFGPIRHAQKCSQQEWESAVREGRTATVYHAENDWCTPVCALIRRSGCVNTICKIVFTTRPPDDIDEIIGMRNSEEAFSLCNPQ